MVPPPRLGEKRPRGQKRRRSFSIAAEGFKRAAAITARRTGSPALSVSGEHSDFFKSTPEATRTQRLNDFFNLLIGLTGQWAGSPLLSAEQFGLGGSHYGRGSDPAEINHGESTCRRGLASAGLGLRPDLTDQLALTAELAKPANGAARTFGDIWAWWCASSRTVTRGFTS